MKWRGPGPTDQPKSYEGVVRSIKELLLIQTAKQIVRADRQQLIQALPADDDVFISETIMSIPGAVFYHLQISKHPRRGHVGKVCVGFDTVEVVMQTDAQGPTDIADSRDDVLDAPDGLLEVVLNFEC